MKQICLFLTLFVSPFVLCVKAQNTAPYWSLAGNSGTTASASSKLGTTTALPLNLVTNNQTRLRIFGDGRVGVGNRITDANATRVLNLADDNAVMRILRTHASFAPAVELISRTTADGPNIAYWDMYAEPKDASFRIRDRKGGGAGLDRLTISGNGMIGIGTTAPVYPLHITSATAQRVLTSVSTFTGFEHRVGIYGQSVNDPEHGFNYGTGVQGEGGAIGVKGRGATGVYGTGVPISEGYYGIGVHGYGTPGLLGVGVVDEEYYTYGTGVVGSGYTGVRGTGVELGVEGRANETGVAGYGTNSYGIYGYTSNPTSYAAYFEGAVYTSGTYQGSDSKLKQNVKEIESAINIINQLQPKTYEYRQDGNFKQMNLPSGRHYGLIAQDVEQVLPHLVKATTFNTARVKAGVPPAIITRQTDSAQAIKALLPVTKPDKGEALHFKAVNYTELIPLMVKAVQELSKENEELKIKTEKMDALEKELTDLKQLVSKLAAGQNINTSLNRAALLQNAPNPVSRTTAIQYSLPEGSSRAQLLLTDALGRTVKSIQLTSAGVVNVDVSALSSGMYTYSLVVDGKTVQTRKMTVKR